MTKKDIIIIVVGFIWLMWLGYRLRQQEEGIRLNDERAAAYFDSLEKAEKKQNSINIEDSIKINDSINIKINN